MSWWFLREFGSHTSAPVRPAPLALTTLTEPDQANGWRGIGWNH
jgi:hypothetical protein